MKSFLARSSLPAWVIVWLALSMPLIFWDIGFVLSRPHSMPGGSLAFLWAPYAKYVTVDLGYADVKNGFVIAQALMTCGEAAVTILGLVLSFRASRRQLAALLVFAGSLLTCTKTLLIFLIEVVTGGEHVGHNPLGDLVLLYVLPNSLWVVVPALASVVTGRQLLTQRSS
jgi:hypothetical protein